VLANVSVGNCAASKKSGDFKWASRSATLVETDEASIEALIEVGRLVASSISRSTVKAVNDPRTFEQTMWRTVNSMLEWAGSRLNVDIRQGCSYSL